MTECEVVAMYEDDSNQGKPTFTLGYGACFGHNEVKAISMAILDRALQKGMKEGASNPSEDPEFVLLHVDGVDSMGFASHYKMPVSYTHLDVYKRQSLGVTRYSSGV